MEKYIISGIEFFDKEEAFDKLIDIIKEDIVKIEEVQIYELVDYSYSRGENLEDYGDLKTKEGYPMRCHILEEGFKIPAYKISPGMNNEYLDTKVRSVNTGNIYYTQKRFLKENNKSDYGYTSLEKMFGDPQNAKKYFNFMDLLSKDSTTKKHIDNYGMFVYKRRRF